MILSDGTIKKLLDNGELVVNPLDISQVQSSSLDLRLGNEFLVYSEETPLIDIKNENIKNYLKKILIKDNESFILQPKQFVLATTYEYIKLPNDLTAFVEGRSSLGRLGLFIENAGWVDAGFEGNITLEFFNANSKPLKIYPKMRICQLVFSKLDEPAEKPYRGKYFKQRGATASKIYMDAK